MKIDNDYYILVDPTDPLELPWFSGSVIEMAEHMQVDVKSIQSAINKAKKKGFKCQYVRVENTE